METIKYRIYPQDSHAIKPALKLFGINLTKKRQMINFEQIKGWTISKNPSIEFEINKTSYSLEFGKKVKLTSFKWKKKKKNGDIDGLYDFREVFI